MDKKKEPPVPKNSVMRIFIAGNTKMIDSDPKVSNLSKKEKLRIGTSIRLFHCSHHSTTEEITSIFLLPSSSFQEKTTKQYH